MHRETVGGGEKLANKGQDRNEMTWPRAESNLSINNVHNVTNNVMQCEAIPR